MVLTVSSAENFELPDKFKLILCQFGALCYDEVYSQSNADIYSNKQHNSTK